MKMVLTFEWDDNECDDNNIVAEREFFIKDEAMEKKDITDWVKEVYVSDKGKHKYFKVYRRDGFKDVRSWVVSGTKGRFIWEPHFMAWADLVLGCTMNYLGWSRDMDADETRGKGYTFVSSEGEVRKFKKLTEVDKFIREEMRRQSGRQEKE